MYLAIQSSDHLGLRAICGLRVLGFGLFIFSVGVQIWNVIRNGYHRNHFSLCCFHLGDHSVEVRRTEGGREGGRE